MPFSSTIYCFHSNVLYTILYVLSEITVLGFQDV